MAIPDSEMKALFTLLPTLRQEDLDFSPGSLNTVEACLLSNVESYAILLEEKHGTAYRALIKYVGETFRQALGGKWTRSIDEPWGPSPIQEYPTIKGYPGEQVTFHFDTMLTAALSRGTGVSISTLLERNLESAAEYKAKVAKTPVRFSADQLDKLRFDSRRAFKSWLKKVPSEVRSLRDRVVVHSIGPALDRSAASLSILENWIIEWYYGSSELLAFGEVWTAKRLAAYVGATMIFHCPSLAWSMRLRGVPKETRGLPVLTAAAKPDVCMCPLLLVLDCADSRTGKVLATALGHATSVLGDQLVPDANNQVERRGQARARAYRLSGRQSSE
jgi:hypothetical protein